MTNAAIELNTVTYTGERVKKTYVNLSNNVTLELLTSHVKERKVMRSIITRIVERENVRTYRPMEDAQVLATMPVGRYSAKLLDSQHDALLYLFDDPEWIEWAERIADELED